MVETYQRDSTYLKIDEAESSGISGHPDVADVTEPAERLFQISLNVRQKVEIAVMKEDDKNLGKADPTEEMGNGDDGRGCGGGGGGGVSSHLIDLDCRVL